MRGALGPTESRLQCNIFPPDSSISANLLYSLVSPRLLFFVEHYANVKVTYFCMKKIVVISPNMQLQISFFKKRYSHMVEKSKILLTLCHPGSLRPKKNGQEEICYFSSISSDCFLYELGNSFI